MTLTATGHSATTAHGSPIRAGTAILTACAAIATPPAIRPSPLRPSTSPRTRTPGPTVRSARRVADAGHLQPEGPHPQSDDDPEYFEGDFETLKDIHHGEGTVDNYEPSAALKAICAAYKFWIAFADVDGFRVDTVKHMDPGATRYFTSVIHEFTQSIGKDNFYLIGEITGGRRLAFNTLEQTGLDAALGIDDIPDKMEYLVKGYRDPSDYFNLFRNSLLVNKESHTWFRNKVVTMFDDHDQVRRATTRHASAPIPTPGASWSTCWR